MTDAKLTHPTIGYRPVLIGDRLITNHSQARGVSSLGADAHAVIGYGYGYGFDFGFSDGDGNGW